MVVIENTFACAAVLLRIKKELGQVTYDHSISVGNLMYNFARFLGYSEGYARNLQQAGYLHDAGKLKIGVELIEKKGRLTDEERKIIEEHPALGGQLLKELGFSKLVQNVAEGHHHGVGNTGYGPSGMADEPDLDCRVAMICDIYDALTSKRSYKEGKTREEAISLMRDDLKCDQTLVAAFVQFLAGKEMQAVA